MFSPILSLFLFENSFLRSPKSRVHEILMKILDIRSNKEKNSNLKALTKHIMGARDNHDTGIALNFSVFDRGKKLFGIVFIQYIW